LGIGMTALCGAIAFGFIPDDRKGGLGVIAGWAGLVFFGLITALVLWRLLTSRGPVVTLSPEGIRDVRVAAETIPWTAVHDISAWGYRGQRIMVLAVDPELEKRLTLTRIARWSRGPNTALGADGLCVTAQGLKIGHDELLSRSIAYAKAAGGA
jgi:hypothetical protein